MITVQKLKIDIQQNWDQATSWPNRTVWSLSVPIEDSKGCEASAKKKRPHRGLRGQFSCKIIRIEKVRNHLLSVKRKPVKGIVGEKKVYNEILCSHEKGDRGVSIHGTNSVKYCKGNKNEVQKMSYNS